MATTFNAIFLGQLAIIDPTEGNNTAENAGALVGQTFGSPGDPLLNDAVVWSPVGNTGGTYENDANVDFDFFAIDGATTLFDAAVAYNATITYVDGTTANITAVIAQDVFGNTFLVPEFSANSDQAALEAQGIRSLTLDSINVATTPGLNADRQEWDIARCFTTGTLIETEKGMVAVENLRAGDKIPTLDHGIQTLRWIGSQTARAAGAFTPVLIKAGALGNSRDLLVSPQHRMLVSDWRVELHSGHAEALAPAKQLVNGHDIVMRPGGLVTYYHLMFDQHELIWAEGCLSESFHPGIQAWNSLEDATRQEILTLFPELADHGITAYGPPARPSLQSFETRASVA
ncbi:Hint domain-containing protein [Ruegeria sp. Ofav3-42]|uniref:Hint domain-containing protein n=1 Tax=Ruegeria sp. Ofav3-42 TaxID=2917759 RepID=UPI001EF4CFEC|nr:Hint domain-containing protein [Ruegeria sp. Ofav3-42]MCG7518161.1 Hint domain-containing protein [Ruegeria sp. Ofav3-42]